VVSEVAGFPIPAGLDYCSSEMIPGAPSYTPPVLAQATDEASPALVPLAQLTPGILAEFLPVYAGGGVPATLDQRRADVQGWVAASFDADVVAELAVAGQSGIAVQVDRTTPTGVERVAQAGDTSGGSSLVQTLPVSADGAWTVTVSQRTAEGSISPGSQAAIVLVSGLVITLLLFVLIRVLGGSRERAMAMVEEKTEELEYQALHDALTGLPNRTLILDRAGQMLARQERTGVPVAALFVDLDDFKSVNDTLGHAAGDAYLCSVAGRIGGLFRGSDSVGRLGGDEFVVLLEGAPIADGPVRAARRILGVLAEPVEIDGVEVPVSCSIGVATGPRATADELLRDADVAMYRAKVAGKGGYAVFDRGSDIGPDSEPERGTGVPSGA
jgi:diguanylate cyclase (GGDEF)-like protein